MRVRLGTVPIYAISSWHEGDENQQDYAADEWYQGHKQPPRATILIVKAFNREREVKPYDAGE